MNVTIKGLYESDQKLINLLPLEVSGTLFYMRQRLVKYNSVRGLFSKMLNNKEEFTDNDIERCLAFICGQFDLTGATLDWADGPTMTFDYSGYKIVVR